MKKLKSNKGITLVALVATIIVLLILTGKVISNLYENKVTGYNAMDADIKLLKDKVLIYYNKYQEIPKTSRNIQIDNKTYYEIDLSKLDNITLIKGKEYNKAENLTTTSDVYVVNDALEIYYLKGVDTSEGIRHN